MRESKQANAKSAIQTHSHPFHRDELRQRAENETRESEYRYRQLIENMSSGMVVYQPLQDGVDFIIKDVNKAKQLASGL